MSARGWIDLNEVRARLTVSAVLADAGCTLPRDRRTACPIHGGDNRTAFSVKGNDRFWTCWSHCGSGDAFLLARKVHGYDFVRALEHCAALVGVTHESRTAADIAAARARREQEQVARRAARAHERDRWLAALHELRQAQEDVYVHGAILRHDHGLANDSTRELFDRLGDPFLREQLAEQRLDAIEAEQRAEREGVARAGA